MRQHWLRAHVRMSSASRPRPRSWNHRNMPHNARLSAYGFARVAVNVPARKEFDYSIPPALRGAVLPGSRVWVPFGHRNLEGFCVALLMTSDVPSLKPIHKLIDLSPALSPSMLRLTRWIADHYFCSWGQVLHAALPTGVRKGTGTRTTSTVTPAASPRELASQADAIEKRAPRQARVLRLLIEQTPPLTRTELARLAHSSPSVVDSLRKKGLVRFSSQQMDSVWFEDVQPTSPPQLTCEQQAALAPVLDSIERGGFEVFLLQGVTGSGKTEIYLRAIDRVVSRGAQAIVLVPEISLTPQTVRRFRERFARVAVLHSSLTEGHRREQWTAMASHRADVVVGARSAIFAPAPRLGLIVVDEEHENTFKQDETPRYHARDVAVRRAHLENLPVILGTATPSLESYYHAANGEYTRLLLSERVEKRPLPPVDVVDMSTESLPRRRRPILSQRLKRMMEHALSRGEQVILFLNRRGFSTYIFCPRCGFVLRCKKCDISLTFHRRLNKAICHYCSFEADPPESCPECLFPGIRAFGLGTERVEQEVKDLFPDFHVARMDSDVTQGRGSHHRILSDFVNGKIRILLGTQMIAKGLDFPNVTLVGVIVADTALNLPDYRATERTFQLLSQVAGRTGRGPKGGRVIVQTYRPRHYAVLAAAKHDYETFARKELQFRRDLNYPPFSRLVRLVVEGPEEKRVSDRAHRVALALRESAPNTQILGPAPAPITRIRGKYRWHIIAKSPSDGVTASMLAAAEPLLSLSGKLQVTVDVDPLDLL